MDGRGVESPGPGRVATATWVVLACAVLFAALFAWHARADLAFRDSNAPGVPLERRYVHAYTATALEPWNGRFRSRKRYVAAWLRADALLAAGDYKAAVGLLVATTGSTPAEPDLLALYRKAQAVQAVETNRKAHLQHAHEGPGGTLEPSDIER